MLGNRGKRINPQFIEIIYSHKEQYLDAWRRNFGLKDKSARINELVESIYETWISGHADNCFVRVNGSSMVNVQKREALQAIRYKCHKVLRAFLKNKPCTTKKNEESLTDSCNTACYTEGLQEDLDEEDEVFMV
eukprot:CAMPEP_0176477314 /NCGR_PEP_ID=MMETSP0200_2-20121128/550_1 /TAXON_ID=947934 /ORGANISM="Chaetoceros sp., Strain GSL56" /LENGTH=133 /DNA_ID=CAMNT_0017873103 /DNA_START=181 /DNA_END=582 /DNA_ORIENTATION=-